MAKYAHVKKGLGTRTSAETKTAQETGAFGSAGLEAADVYADLDSVKDNAALSDGDFVIFSDGHIAAYSADPVITNLPSLTFISVSDTSAGVYSSGANESVNGAYDLLIRGGVGKIIHSYGVDFTSGAKLRLGDVSENALYFHDCSVTTTAAGSSASSLGSQAGCLVDLTDCVVDFGAGYSTGIGGAAIYMHGGELLSSYSAGAVFSSSGGGGSVVHLDEVDISGLTSGSLFRASTTNQDVCDYTASRCKFPGSLQILNGDAVAYPTQTVDIWSCDTGDGYHYFEYWRYEGQVLEDTTIYRDGGSHYDVDNPTTTNFSAEFLPNTKVVPYTQPLRIKILDLELDLTSANTLTFHIALGDTSTITAADVKNDLYWIELVQNSDATTSKALGITISTKPATILTTPTALANTSTTWTWPTPPTDTKEFQIPVTTTVVSGATKGQVTAYLCVSEYISTRQIFACASPVIT